MSSGDSPNQRARRSTRASATDRPTSSSSSSSRASSAIDSQREVSTAVNTPGVHSPAGSSRNLALLKRVETEALDGPTLADGEKGREGEERKGGYGGGGPLGMVVTGEKLKRMTSTEATQLEMDLLNRARSQGLPAHTEGEEGVVEKKEVVDLGNGPEEVIIVDWLPDDPENPFNWSQPRKYLTVFVAVLITGLTAGNATSTGVMAYWAPEWFNVSREAFETSLTVYMIAIAFTPLVLAPMSEVFGRNMIYQVTSVLNALLFIPQALSRDFSGLLAARWFQGMVSSVGNSMVGGTVADVFRAKDRGLAMNVFSLVIFQGQGLLALAIGYVGQYWGIQWCYGVQGIAATLSIVLNALVLRETRSDVLLARRAKKLTKATGIKHICAAELQKKSFVTLVTVSAVRPMKYLFTEPIVSALSTWIGFAWAVVFMGTSSTLLVFADYGFSPARTGTFEACVCFGGILGFVSSYHQEYLYRRAMAASPTGKAAPEVRLYWGAIGGIMFPISTFIYAWTGRPNVHWVVPAIFLSISYWGVFCMYSSVFNYLADAYETYSSSAQAAQSFARNFCSGVFPLFARQMYVSLTNPIASTLVAAIASVLAVAPILLIIYGQQLRARSKVASALAMQPQQ